MKRSVAVVLVIAAVTFGTAVLAESPQPFQDFTFKRVKPPKSGSGKRITVQIDPGAVPQPSKQPAEQSASQISAAVGQDGRFGWFWAQVSPDLANTGPGRLEPALVHLANPPQGQGITAPRLSDMMAIARQQGPEMLLRTVGTGVSPALVLAVISVESGGRTDAVSGAGAQGLMQLIPATAERFGVADSLNAGENIRGGVAYLDWLLKEFDGDPILALAAYNAGENAVKKHGGVPPYAETRDYVPKVLAAFSVARGLCRTPPQLISDGCVFNLGS
ncbi:lytic transglycosylase domain-containing protein [Thalassovita taeanensis]|uniref:Transglycosylase SLT domain-containing protein n=1 Tax=Thalassovita taeanensis TaxID=657014 RepID=A0A1H9AA60_9RHOB|nr:lytic transglycosylase domain-containing protein [Thalassovita taeanensis]SEP73622.1 Transglycosylase SLT domain-containing protein [Thalassovita taeanensis]